jgi:hypothetical protein
MPQQTHDKQPRYYEGARSQSGYIMECQTCDDDCCFNDQCSFVNGRNLPRINSHIESRGGDFPNLGRGGGPIFNDEGSSSSKNRPSPSDKNADLERYRSEPSRPVDGYPPKGTENWRAPARRRAQMNAARLLLHEVLQGHRAVSDLNRSEIIRDMAVANGITISDEVGNHILDRLAACGRHFWEQNYA